MTQKHNGQWNPVELGEIIDIFDSTRVPLNSRQRAERQGRFPYYGASGVIDSVDDYLFDGEYVLVAEDGENLNSRKLPVAFMARGQFWVNNHAHIIKGKKRVADDRFLIAWFAQADIKGYITGAAQPKLSQANLKRIALTAPPYIIQRKIAGVLSAYDDLIENNTRRITILEEMAQAIYREWFVNFRFPDHGKVKLINSPLGKIPVGWKPQSIGSTLDFHIGGGWGQETADNEFRNPAFVIRGTDIPDARALRVVDCPLRYHTDSNICSRKLRSNDLVFEVSGGSKEQPVGRCLFVSERLLRRFDGDVICASFCKLIRPNRSVLAAEILYHFFAESYTDGIIEKYEVQSTGIKNFKFTVFLESEYLAIPPITIQESFIEQVRPILDSIHVLGKKNEILRNTRDLLLPKLIGGQLDVEELDIDAGELLLEATM